MPSDLDQCRTLLRGGSRSFHAASLILPRRIREPASAVYAFCRLADDAIDNGGDTVWALSELHQRLDVIYRGGVVATPADRAFGGVVRQFAIPRALPDGLLEGFCWDAESRRYETLEDVCAYAVRVAGTVGAMMTLLMGQRDPAVLARAIDLGVAMQLTNIARDVGEDARAGRIYLPLRWLREAGIDPECFLVNPQFTPALGGVVKRLLISASTLYARSQSGVACLPASCRAGIHAARLLYCEIGNQVERNGFDSISQRAVVPSSRKLLLMGEVALATIAPAQSITAPVLTEARFLIDAVAASHPPRGPNEKSAPVPWWRFRERAVRQIALFDRLARRDQIDRVNL